LFEEVDPEILQQALDETIERFPYYKSVLRRGIFGITLRTAISGLWLKKRINRLRTDLQKIRKKSVV